ncbi:hypothetical protein MTZ49_10925 [Entomomonas sp. E2T0]|uniref:hypothetical protein n=1 Tax=Entomomonas sp. E2T0 TaxID=2930213 RepID=UPI0022283C8D|nr:hypothetical protein [Entomomonas sp. E2T0]UYZ83112.1 hypothetical protein MTZ49_10925 [Entomomonas sp. E2T0]
MNLNIPKLETRQLFELILKVQYLVSVPTEHLLITSEELPIWRTLGDVVIITDINVSRPFIYTHKVFINTQHKLAAEELIFRIFNEFLPFYYLDRINQYKAIVDAKYGIEEITVPLLKKPFNANEQPTKHREGL